MKDSYLYYKLYLLFIAVIVILCCSCTDHTRARMWGGTEVIYLPKNEKLLEVTWKERNSLWYLTEPMEDSYTPKVKIFKEDSKFGILEGTVKFIESK